MGDLTVGDLIEALQQFPKDWSVCLGVNEETVPIKGVMDCSESDDFGGLHYAFVEIAAMEDLDLHCFYDGNVEMYGDSNWYNTKDTFRSVFGDLSHIEYTLNDKGKIQIKECKNMKGENIELHDINDIDGFWRIMD